MSKKFTMEEIMHLTETWLVQGHLNADIPYECSDPHMQRCIYKLQKLKMLPVFQTL